MQDRQGTNDLANGAVRYGVYDASGNRLRYEWLLPGDEPLEAGTPLTAGNLLTAQTVANETGAALYALTMGMGEGEMGCTDAIYKNIDTIREALS